MKSQTNWPTELSCQFHNDVVTKLGPI